MMENCPDAIKAMEEGNCLFGTVDTWLIWVRGRGREREGGREGGEREREREKGKEGWGRRERREGRREGEKRENRRAQRNLNSRQYIYSLDESRCMF